MPNKLQRGFPAPSNNIAMPLGYSRSRCTFSTEGIGITNIYPIFNRNYRRNITVLVIMVKKTEKFLKCCNFNNFVQVFNKNDYLFVQIYNCVHFLQL